jgi:tellurite resistance protein
MEPTSIMPPATVVGGIPLKEPERHRAFIAAAQRDLNAHLRRLGAVEVLAVDGEWDEHTEKTFVEVCSVLGLAPKRDVRTFRLIAGAAEAVTDAELALAAKAGVTAEKQLRERFARERALLKPMSEDERERAYVAALQRDLNRHLVRRGLPPRVMIDGDWDATTDEVFRSVCAALKIPAERTVRTYRLIAGAAARPMRERGDLVVLGGRSLPRDERDKAFIASVQRDINQHLVRLGSPAILAVDGKWGDDTDRAYRRVLATLGVEPARSPRNYRVIAGTLAHRTEAELKRAEKEGAAYERKLRRHFAKQTVVVQTQAAKKPAAAAKPHPHGAHRRNGQVTTAAAKPARNERVGSIIRHFGGRYEDHIISASARTGVSVSLLCAVIEQETHFTNVFGHDNVANPIKSPPGSNRPVTKALYKEYKKHRDRKLGCQGVGPMQLTDRGLQDAADKLGGCWRVGPNIQVGADHLRNNIKAHGSVRGGLVGYNGGASYPDAVLPLQAKWAKRLGSAAGVAARGPRTLRVTEPLMKGEDVKTFQRVLNKRFAKWHVPIVLDVDGEFGTQTRRSARQVAHGLGLSAAEYEHGITPAVQAVIQKPTARTADQKARFAKRAAFRKKLRGHAARQLASGAHGPLQAKAYAEARKLVGVMEVGGNNRGAKVLEVIHYAGGPGPEAWCVDFVIWCYGHAGSGAVRPGFTRAVRFMKAAGLVQTSTPKRGDIVRYSFDHTGLFVKDNGNGTITTIEGNTGRSGAVSDSSTGGDGVYLKVRSKSLVRDYLRVTR